MKVNVGSIDRALRIALGIILLALTATGTVGLWGLFGIVLLVTGVMRFCPVYPLLGINTCPMQRATNK